MQSCTEEEREKLVSVTMNFMTSANLNPYCGSVPVERIQNVVRENYQQLYAKVVGSTKNSWGKFIGKPPPHLQSHGSRPNPVPHLCHTCAAADPLGGESDFRPPFHLRWRWDSGRSSGFANDRLRDCGSSPFLHACGPSVNCPLCACPMAHWAWRRSAVRKLSFPGRLGCSVRLGPYLR